MRPSLVFVCLLLLSFGARSQHDDVSSPDEPSSSDPMADSVELNAADATTGEPGEGPSASGNEEAPASSGPEQPSKDRRTEALEERLVTLEQRLDGVEDENERLKRRLEKTRRDRLEVPHLTFLDGVRVRLRGYGDVGAFYAFGDGVAYVRDSGKRASGQIESFPWLVYPDRKMPDAAAVPWVFFGDPWANPVNSQGDSADLGLDRTAIPRFDPIASGGGFSFLVNMVNAGFVASIGDDLLFELGVNLEPRQGVLGSPGDVLDIDLAYLDWAPFEGVDLHLFAGKFESTFGREYRFRQAPDRVGITPSIISRYTVGNPTGVKARGSLFDGAFTYNVALTNGGMMTEKFAHFHNEIDKNSVPTASARVSLVSELELVLPLFFELGVSGLAGSQDLQPDASLINWQVGVDARLSAGDLTLTGEYLRGVVPGGGVVGAPSLDFEGAYLESSYLIFAWLTAVGRLDYRRALLFAMPNLYITDVARASLGARFDLTWNMVAKVEYLRVQELTGPEINDDILTSSFLFRF